MFPTPALDAFLIIAKAVIVALGGAITVLAYRAFRRTGSRAMRSFTAGFGAVTFGAVLGGSLNQFLGVGLRKALLVQSAVTALGLAILFASLYVEEHVTAAA
ncbi:MAG: hypothetical protein ABEJ88_02125 [Halobacterium sp.]